MKPATLTAAQVKSWIPGRPLDTHKGKNGHVLVVAGSRGMTGAAALSGLGALRTGAGLATIAVPESERMIVASFAPEFLTLGLDETPQGTLAEGAIVPLRRYLETHAVNVLAVGPGIAVNAQTATFVRDILDEFDLPVVLDADGLNNLRAEDFRGHRQLVITPHPLELSRLTGIDRQEIRADRAGAAQRIARDFELVCVLKGKGTVVTDGARTRINPTGNPAMAAGGMGDVLTGALAALIAQGLGRFEAACAAVYLHGLAADLARTGDRGLLARDVADALPRAIKKIGVTYA